MHCSLFSLILTICLLPRVCCWHRLPLEPGKSTPLSTTTLSPLTPAIKGIFVSHLDRLKIPRGNPAIYSLINFIFNVVGTFVKGVLGFDDRHISVVVETTLKLFPAHGRYHLLDTEVTTIFSDYEGRNLRCCYCLSYRHLSSACRQPRPRFFSSPALILDVEAETPSLELVVAPASSNETGTRSQSARSGDPREPRPQGATSKQSGQFKPKRTRLRTQYQALRELPSLLGKLLTNVSGEW